MKSITNAHGESNGILSLTTLRYRDIFASGSSDRYIRIWRISESFNRVEEIYSILLKGLMNS